MYAYIVLIKYIGASQAQATFYRSEYRRSRRHDFDSTHLTLIKQISFEYNDML